MVRSPTLPDPGAVRTALRPHGGSIVILTTGDLLKAHIHTDAPDAVFKLASTWGTLESTKADDMRAQHQALQARRPIAFVSDTACDLPDELVLQYDIGLVPMQLIVDDRAYRDRLELTPGEFFRRLRTGHDASTSQPAPQAFADAYKDAARAADQVIAVVVSSALSGTHGNAESAARHFDSSRVTVLDSRSASLGEGLLVIRGVELAAAGWEADAIVKELQRVRAQSEAGDGAYYGGEDRAGRPGARPGCGSAPHDRVARSRAHATPEVAAAGGGARRHPGVCRSAARRAGVALPADTVSGDAHHAGNRRARRDWCMGRFLSE